MIHFLQPYAFNGMIGTAYNVDIMRMPKDSWICITDHDTLKPPGFADRVKKVLDHHGRADRLFGAMTNRVGYRNAAVVPSMYNNDSITDHLDMAKTLWKQNGTELKHTEIVCGYCMVFNKKLWEEMGGFPARTIVFDKQLSGAASECWTMTGVYILHLYRWGMANPETRVRHLQYPGTYLK
jgi:hypothetical protein